MRRASLEPLALNVAVFLLLALSLSVPSGYSWGAGLLLVLGLLRLPAALRGRLDCPRDMRAWAVAVMLMGLAWALHIVDEGQLITSSLGLDRCIKYLLVLLTLPALLAQRPVSAVLDWGCWMGAAGAGLTALWQVGVAGEARASGYTNAIQFGNLALLLAAWSSVRALRARQPVHKLIGGLAALLGVAASLASGSRGGWATLPAMLLLLFWFSAPPRAPRQVLPRALRALALTLATCLVLLALPPVQQRIALAVNEWQQQEVRADDNSSVGLRRAFWVLAWQVGQAHPWIGAGQRGYEARQSEAVARREMPEAALQFNHAHNEWLDMFAKRGLLGVGALALFFAVPGVIFARGLRRGPTEAGASAITDERRAAALCGLMTVLGFIGFGLTQAIFAHNNGNMMYLLAVTIWLACLRPAYDGLRLPP